EKGGELGVFAPTSLPEGVDPNAVRQCTEHPQGNVTKHGDGDACFFGGPYGCTRGYCWKQCHTPGRGQWCWTAFNNGFGAWRTCSTDQDCIPNTSTDCGQGCPSCGCSC